MNDNVSLLRRIERFLFLASSATLVYLMLVSMVFGWYKAEVTWNYYTCLMLNSTCAMLSTSTIRVSNFSMPFWFVCLIEIASAGFLASATLRRYNDKQAEKYLE